MATIQRPLINNTWKIIILIALAIIATVLFMRWLNPPAKPNEYYKSQLDSLKGELKATELRRTEVLNKSDIVDTIIREYKERDAAARLRYQSTMEAMRRNEIILKDLQKKYEKINSIDTFSRDNLRKYVSDY